VVEHGTPFVACEFCGAANFVDKSRAVFHYTAVSTLDVAGARAALRRWMAGNETVKNLDRKARVEPPEFEYFPMWMVRVAEAGGERILCRPAAAVSVSVLGQVQVRAGDLKPYQPAAGATVLEPTVSRETMLEWLTEGVGMSTEAIREVSLVHLPIFRCRYSFQDRRFVAVVDGVTSQVFANIYPVKWEVPYVALGVASCLAYFTLAVISLQLGLSIYLVGAPLVGAPLFLAALATSAKV
jgi:hypothetical protein